jgi:hypothetical protein
MCLNKYVGMGILVLCSVSAWADDNLWEWRASAGIAQRSIGDVSFRVAGYSDAIMFSPQTALGRKGPYADVGALDSHGDREYDDGYVRQDPFTAEYGDTWNWGYEQSSQVNGDSLLFHAADGTDKSFSRSRQITAGDWAKDGGDELAPSILLEALRVVKPYAKAGVQIGFLPVSFSVDENVGTMSEIQKWKKYAYQITDVYNLGGAVPPPAPYSGTYDGPGFIISNQPASRVVSRTLIGSGSFNAYNEVYNSLDLDLFTVNLGPVLEIHGERVFLSFGAGPSLNVIQTEAIHEERLYTQQNRETPELVQSWRDCENETTVEAGVYVQAGVGAKLTQHLGLQLYGRYDWLNDVDGSVGPSSFSVDPSGHSIGLLLSVSL